MPSLSLDRQSKIVTFVRQMFDMVDSVMAARTTNLRKVEQRYRSFIDPTEVNTNSNKRQYPWDDPIVVPYSYALIQAIVAYWYTLFTSQSPLKQVQDARGNNLRGADLMEMTIAYYDRINEANKLLYGALLDACKYGYGGGKTLWDERWETRRQKVRRPVSLLGMNLGMTEETIKKTEKTFDGPLTTLFDPWLMAFDPRVALADFQKGNFVGETIFTSWYGLKEHEEPYGPYENLNEIPRWGYKDALAVTRQTNRLMALGLPNYYDVFANEHDRGFVMLEQLWARVIPSDFDLGPGDRPEMWLFTLANRQALIQAEPVDLPHNKFPYWVIESSPDMHSILNPGVFEIILPLQDVMDWLFNSRMQNVRKALNDMFVADPERVYIGDLLNPAPMKVIRLRPEYYGTDIRSAVQQLPVSDVTGSHMQDISMIFDLMQRISAALDALMGVPSARRRTATESAGTMQLAANRLKVYAQLISGSGLVAWGQQQAALLQEHMTEDLAIQIVGARRWPEFQQMAQGSVIHVSPSDIMGEWNFPVHDGSMPLDPVRMSETWEKVLAGAARIPEIAQQYDLGKIFERGLRALGIRDVDELKKVVGPGGPGLPGMRVMPDQEVQQRVTAGTLVPLTNGAGAAGAGPSSAGAGPRGLSPAQG
jgi:hypothetical protein